MAADEQQVAVGHFNISDLAALKAVYLAAREVNVPVLIGVSEGERRFKRVAVAADTEKLTPPCGACRQILWEFCGDIEIVLVNPRGRIEEYRLKELFPKPFDVSYL